jgi:hypothetical protein
MTALATIKVRSPYAYDAIRARSARAAKAVPQKNLARAFNVTQPTASRMQTSAECSPLSEVIATVYALASGIGSTALPLIEELECMVIEIEVRRKTNDELRHMHKEATEREHDLEANENRSTAHCFDIDRATPEQIEAAAKTDHDEALVQRTRAEVRREIARRMREGSWK